MKHDIENAIFTPSPKKNVNDRLAKRNHGTNYYVPANSATKHDDAGNGLGDAAKALACEVRAGTTKYFIRISDRGLYFDFTDPTHNDTISKVVNGIPLWSMREVQFDQFEQYLAFLRTSNHRYLTQTRQVFNG